MADVTIHPTAVSLTNERDALHGPYWINPTTGYVITLDNNGHIQTRKTADSGATWALQDAAGEPPDIGNRSMSAWYDKETPENTGTLIHIAYVNTNNDVRYIQFDTSADTYGTERTVDSLTISSSSTDQDCSVTVSKSGRVYVAARGDFEQDTENTDHSMRSSSDGFASDNVSEASPYSADEEVVKLFPGADADEDDISAVVFDAINQDLEFWKFDASVNSWSDTAIDTAISTTGTEGRLYKGLFDAVIRQSDENILVAYFNDFNSTTGDFKCVDITQATPTITDKTDLHTDIRQSGFPSILINQQNDDVYVAYAGSDADDETLTSTVRVYFKKSDDGMATWGTEQTYGILNDDIRTTSLGRTIGGEGGRIMPAFHNEDLSDALINDGNDVLIPPQKTFTVDALIGTPTIAHVSTTSQGDTGNDNSVTISSHVVSGTDPVLVVKVAQKGSRTVTGITWNGTENLTQLNTDINGDARADIWYLAAPTATTADVVVTLSGNTTRKVAAASTYSGVHQSVPFRVEANSSNNGTNTNPTTNVVANFPEMVVDSMCQVSAGPDTINSQSSTNRSDDTAVGGGTDCRGASGEIASSGATETMDYNMSSNDNWAICAGALQQPGSIEADKTFTVDAFLKATFEKEFTADALLQVIDNEKTFTADAILTSAVTTIDKDFTVDAIIIQDNIEKTFTVDSILKATQEKEFTVDAFLLEEAEKTFTADAFLQVIDNEITFTADAILKATQEKTFTADAILKQSNIEKTFTVDAIVVNVNTKTLTTDALLQATQIKTFTVDSILVNVKELTFTADAVLTLTGSKDFTVDALLRAVQEKTFTTDAIIKQSNIEKTFTADSILVNIIEKTFTADSLIRLTSEKTFTTDSILVNVKELTFTVDAILQATQEKTFTADAILKQSNIDKTFTVDAILSGGLELTFTVDAILKKADNDKTFTVDAFLRAIQTKTFTADSILVNVRTKTLTADAFLRAVQEKTFTADALLQETFPKTLTADALLRAVQTKTFTSDALIRLTSTKTFTTDAFLQVIDNDKTFTTDSLLQATFTKTFTIDTFVRAVQTKTFTTDAILKQSNIEKTFTADAILTSAGAVDKTFTVDAFLRLTSEKEFTVDAILGAVDQGRPDLLPLRRLVREKKEFKFDVSVPIIKGFSKEVEIIASIQKMFSKSLPIALGIVKTLKEEIGLKGKLDHTKLTNILKEI